MAGTPLSSLHHLGHPPRGAAGPWWGESTAVDGGEPRGGADNRDGGGHAQTEPCTNLRAVGRLRAARDPGGSTGVAAGGGTRVAAGGSTGVAGVARRSQRSPCRVARAGPEGGPRLAAQGSCGRRSGVMPG